MSVAAVVAVVVFIVLLQRPGTSSSGDLVPPPANVAASALGDGEALGRADARLELEIWADFQCPVCGSLARDYLPRLITDFVVPGKVRIVSRDIAILGRASPNESLAAAVGARCAGAQGQYWAYHDWLYQNQQGENRGAFSAERLAAIADRVGLDRGRWDACVDDPAQAAAIQRNTADGRAAGITSTPTFRFAGQSLVGLPRTYDELAAAIQAALGSPAPATGTPGLPSSG